MVIQVSGNAYEYCLVEGKTPWKSNIRAGITYLLPNDKALIEDITNANECMLVAELFLDHYCGLAGIGIESIPEPAGALRI